MPISQNFVVCIFNCSGKCILFSVYDINSNIFIGTHISHHLIYKIEKPCKSHNAARCILIFFSLFVNSI